MKTLKSFILVSLFLSVSGVSFACGPWYYSAADNRIYRFLPPNWQTPTSFVEDFETKNIKAWSKETNCKDTAAIRSALYTDWNNFVNWDELLWEMTTSSAAPYNPMTENMFCRHLVATMDTDAVRLLCWSKTYSNIRNGQRSPWYYNSHIDTDEKKQLREMYEKITSYTPAKKYADRFKFLSIKCAWALGEDNAVITLWEQSKLHQKKNLFYHEAKDYVARSLTRMGRQKEADDIYYENGNYAELIPLGASTPTQLRTLLRLRPNSPQIAPILQGYLTILDVEQASTYRWEDEDDYYKTDSVVRIARMAIDNPKVRQKAMWRYAAACVLDYKGKQKEALEILKGAENGDGNTFLQKAVRTLTFYLRARTDTINDDFEHYAINEIKWLDNEMLREWKRMPDTTRYSISHVLNCRWIRELNDLYSYAALRRIVLEDSVGLAWRMVEAGRGERALQMANVADNHLVQISNNPFINKVRKQGGGVYDIWYRGSDSLYHSIWLTSLKDTSSLEYDDLHFWNFPYNTHDYSNGLFCVADIMDARTIEAYRQRQLRPKDDIDRWFNARSYTNGDYWQDIIGTHYLRERNYSSAIAHLKYISSSYQKRMNVSFKIDPFSIDRTMKSDDSVHYKLRFAQRMDSLQHVMLHDHNANHRGLAMLEYTIGLENSFGMCWWLTSYGKGWHGANLTDIEETPYAYKANVAVNQLRDKALRTLHSDDARARYHLRLGQYSIVRKQYAYTKTGKQLALVCDEMKLYRAKQGNTHKDYLFLNEGENSHNGFANIYEFFAPPTVTDVTHLGYEYETEAQFIKLTKIERAGWYTKLYKTVVPKGSGTWINCSHDEFIEDAKTGRKCYLKESSISIAPAQTILYTNDTMEIVETYPALPNNTNQIYINAGKGYYNTPIPFIVRASSII